MDGVSPVPRAMRNARAWMSATPRPDLSMMTSLVRSYLPHAAPCTSRGRHGDAARCTSREAPHVGVGA
eukprot:1020391-Prymnesium_polylepis.2